MNLPECIGLGAIVKPLLVVRDLVPAYSAGVRIDFAGLIALPLVKLGTLRTKTQLLELDAMILKQLALGSLAIFFSISLAAADEINYQVRTNASGSLGGVAFNDQLITISAVGDTDNVQTNGSTNLLLTDIVVSVEIAGLGSAVFVDAIQAVSNNNSELGGFGNTSTATGMIFVNDPVFADYDLRSELGPVTGLTLINTASHATDAGNLFLSASTGPGVFEASFTSIPEPSVTAAALMFLAGLSVCRRR